MNLNIEQTTIIKSKILLRELVFTFGYSTSGKNSVYFQCSCFTNNTGKLWRLRRKVQE